MPFFERGLGATSAKFVYGDELAVDVTTREKGIGTALMIARIEAYRKRFGAESGNTGAFMFGRTDMDSRMVPIYENLGFRFTGIMDPQYQTRGYFVKRLQ